MLQVGGEQEAVTDPEPGNGVETVQDCGTRARADYAGLRESR